jgi:hypothetical protein
MLRNIGSPHNIAMRSASATGGANNALRAILALCLAIIVVLTLVAVVGASHFGEPKRCLNGFWAGDPTFLAEAGLSDMYLTLEHTKKRSSPMRGVPGRGASFHQYDGYLFMATPQGVICNQPVQFRFKVGQKWKRKDVYEGPAYFVPSDFDACPLVAEYVPGDITYGALSSALSPAAGSLALKQDGELRALFFKDNGASAAMAAALQDVDEEE